MKEQLMKEEDAIKVAEEYIDRVEQIMSAKALGEGAVAKNVRITWTTIATVLFWNAMAGCQPKCQV